MSVKRLVPLNTLSLATDPSNPRLGDVYLNSTTNNLRVYTAAGWVEVGAGGGAAVSIGTTPPATPNEGDLWYNNVNPHFYTYDGTYWVEVSFGPVGPVGPGLATGGTTGQIAAKASNTDYDVTWVNPYTSTNFNTDFSAKTTTNLTEGNNLYFTNQRALDAVTSYVDTAVNNLSNTSATTYIPQSDAGALDGVATLDSNGYVPITQLGNLINGAPAVLDTLNELATAIGNDANFTTNVYNGITNVSNSVLDTEIDIIMGVM